MSLMRPTSPVAAGTFELERHDDGQVLLELTVS